MTWTDPVDPVANVTAFQAAREKTYILDNLRSIAEWTSYTPTLVQSGAVTKTVTYAKYRSFGGVVEVLVYLTVTGAGSAGNAIAVGLPVTGAASTRMILGSGLISHTGTANYPVLVENLSTTTVDFWRSDQPPTARVGADPSFALANTDFITFQAVYEAA